MKTTLSLLFVLSLNGIVSCYWTRRNENRRRQQDETSGSKNEAIRCFTEMQTNGQITNLLLDVTTPEKIDTFCRQMSGLTKCISDNEHYLTVAENADYLKKTRGVRDFYINVCPPGTDITEKYKAVSPCFELIRTEILSCGSDLPDMSSYRMKSDKRRRCCALASHEDCVTRAAMTHCGDEAVEVLEKILLRYFQPQWEGCESIPMHECLEQDQTSTLSSTRKTESDKGFNRPWNPSFNHDTATQKTDFEDWSQTTVADQWKKPKHKNGANYATAPNLYILFAILLQVVFSKCF